MITDEKKAKIVNNFLDWCEKIGYSGKDGVRITIVDGLPVGAERPTQSLRFDVEALTKGRQNSTMD